MKASYILIVSVLMAQMLVMSDAGRAKKSLCSKECTEFIKNKIEESLQAQTEELKKLKSDNQAQTEELNKLKRYNQAQTEELNELKSDNQGLQSAVESLNKTLTQLQDQFAENVPCYSSPCLNEGTCSNEPGGGYSCQCKSGFAGDTCEEIRSCDSSPCLNGGNCTDEPGGNYSCQCKSGYGGETCEENISCDSSPCLNGGNCSVEPEGGYKCQCNSGFVGETCAEEIRSCDSSPCLNGGNCTDEPGGNYSCQCKSGYGGETCEENISCDSSPCLNGGNCSNEPGGGYSCQCKSGFVGETCAEGVLTESSILGGLDSKYRDQLNDYLAPVLQTPSRSKFVKCWHAKTDGWAASKFHSNCDGKGPTVTIIQVDSYIFGGSWSSSCTYTSSRKAFIFSLYNINGYAPVKLEIKQERASGAIYGCSDRGPSFGVGHDIGIADNAGNNQDSYTNCGHTYPLPPGDFSSDSSCTFYTGSYKFTPTDTEVLYETII